MPLIIKRLCYGLLWLVLLLPALQAKWHWVEETPLDGAYEPAPRAEFSLEGLAANTYQPALERYVEDRLGFRGWLVRLRNQLGYSVFHESWANHIAVGRDQILFPPEDLDAYVGTNYVGEDKIQFDVRRARAVQDTLARHGVQLLYVLAPSKASFMPENIPWQYRRRAAAHPINNYEAYAKALPAAGVHVLDLSHAFDLWKANSPYPLFARGGMHWSMYGGGRAADTLQHYLQQTLHIPAAPFQLAPTADISDSPRETDGDLAKTLNLLSVAPTGPLAYPRLDYLPQPAGTRKPNVLLIADSFGWTWIYNQFFGTSFSPQSRYWYYNKEVAWPGDDKTPEGRDMYKLKQRAQYLSRDLIIVMFYARNLGAFDYGFSQECFNQFAPFTAVEEARRTELVNKFRAQASWQASTKENFEQHLRDTAATIIERERIMGRRPESSALSAKADAPTR